VAFAPLLRWTPSGQAINIDRVLTGAASTMTRIDHA
jgi:hypothetical protein